MLEMLAEVTLLLMLAPQPCTFLQVTYTHVTSSVPRLLGAPASGGNSGQEICRHSSSGVHIHNGVLLAIKKNTFESVLMRWMKLEPIIQSEVSQKEKHQYSILMHIYGI